MPDDSLESRVAVVERRVDDHEKVCAERYSDLKEGIKSITKILWGVAVAFSAYALGVIGTLLYYGPPWGHH